MLGAPAYGSHLSGAPRDRVGTRAKRYAHCGERNRRAQSEGNLSVFYIEFRVEKWSRNRARQTLRAVRFGAQKRHEELDVETSRFHFF